MSDDLKADRDKLQKFKDYVHARLDAAGVPTDPDSPHKAEGCRIGGRLDVLIGARDELLAALKAARHCVALCTANKITQSAKGIKHACEVFEKVNAAIAKAEQPTSTEGAK